MAQTTSPSFPLKDSSISSAPPPVTPSVAMPDAAGIVDAARFDELAQLRTQNRELHTRNTRLTAERDF